MLAQNLIELRPCSRARMAHPWVGILSDTEAYVERYRTRLHHHLRRRHAPRLPSGRHARRARSNNGRLLCRASRRQGQRRLERKVGHYDFQPRCAQPAGPLRHEARRAQRDSRAVQTHLHQGRLPHLRNPPKARRCRGQVLSRALLLSHGCSRPRHRPPDDADRPSLHRGHRRATRRLRAGIPQGPAQRATRARHSPGANGPDRRQHAARPGCGLSGQGLRPVRAQLRPVEGRLQSARPPATQGNRRGSARPPARAAASGGRYREEVRVERIREVDGRELRRRLPPDDQREGARGLRPHEGAARCARALRPHALRPVLPARATARRARRALRDRQHLPHRLW